MDRNLEQTIDSRPAAAAKEAENNATDMFRNCVEQLRTPGGSSVVDILYDDNGDQAASRIRTRRSTEFTFNMDGQKYSLKQGPVPDAGLYRVGKPKEDGGNEMTKVDPATAEYDRALDTIHKIDFDNYPRC